MGGYGGFVYLIPANITGVDSIIYCYNNAVSEGDSIFGISFGNVCIRGGQHYPIDSFGRSDKCTMPCGNDTLNSGAICGGQKYSSNNVEIIVALFPGTKLKQNPRIHMLILPQPLLVRSYIIIFIKRLFC